MYGGPLLVGTSPLLRARGAEEGGNVFEYRRYNARLMFSKTKTCSRYAMIVVKNKSERRQQLVFVQLKKKFIYTQREKDREKNEKLNISVLRNNNRILGCVSHSFPPARAHTSHYVYIIYAYLSAINKQPCREQ